MGKKMGVGLALLFAWLGPVLPANAGDAADLADRLRQLNGAVFTDNALAREMSQVLAANARARLRVANERENLQWQAVRNRVDWERFRDSRLAELRASLGTFPPVPADLKVQVTRTLDGDGFRIDNLVFESRPGLLVTANLYRPADPPGSMLGILICHSHHAPKTQGELQDMGMTWARQGCLVLVLDQLGHGERRQHPFVNQKAYAGSFRAGRQDYFFRYNLGLQLHLIGDSLVGWMVWDLMRGVDLLLKQPGIDKDRIILLGAVAGGGDPAAVTAALDPRIAAVVPFNFGGPQPETTYPLPADAETRFNYAGSGSWESTRNLRLSARDGFLPWVIVGSVAPRRLVYAHEFAWDRERDPVWQRLERVYSFYGARDNLAGVAGRGKLAGKPPESTHCTNIGPEHRKPIYPFFQRWFRMAEPNPEYRNRRPAADLLCLTPEIVAARKARPVHELAAAIGAERAAAARRNRAQLPPELARARLRQEWARLLGNANPVAPPEAETSGSEKLGPVAVERVVLKVEPNIPVPLLLFVPPHQARQRLPVMVALSQQGKEAFLKRRSEAIARLLEAGVAVCLPDVRGTGETRPGDGRGRSSAATSLSATELMLGQTLLGSQLRDLRFVLAWLRKRPDLDSSRIALWGGSFANVNPVNRNLAVPLDADPLPVQAEPLGGLLALLGGVFEEEVRAVLVSSGLVSYQSLLGSPFLYVSHDAVVPGALTVSDLSDLGAALAPRPFRLEYLVDGTNRKVPADLASKAWDNARPAYRQQGAGDHFLVAAGQGPEGEVPWLLAQLQKK